MAVTQYSLTGASDILAASSSLTAAPEVDAGLMAALNQKVQPSNWLDGALDVLYGWVLSQLDIFQNILDSLCGDGEQIAQAQTGYKQCAIAVEAKDWSVQTAEAVATAVWQGKAKDQFEATIQALLRVFESYAGAVNTVAALEGTLGESTAVTKEIITSIVKDMLGEITRWGVGALFAGPTGIQAFCTWAAVRIAQTAQLVYDIAMDLIERATTLVGHVQRIGDALARAARTLQTGEIQRAMGDPAKPGTAGDAIKGPDPQEKDVDLAKIVSNSGSDDDKTTDMEIARLGYSRVDPHDAETLARYGLTPDMLSDQDNGFGAHLYLDRDGKPIIVFDGTDFNNPKDVAECGIGGVTVSPHTQNVMEVVRALESSGYADEAIYTGHSLGGRLAAEAGMASGNGAVIFNAAGVSEASINYIASQRGMTPESLRTEMDAGSVRSYRNDNDVLYLLQEHMPGVNYLMPDAVGVQHTIPGSHKWVLPPTVKTPLGTMPQLVHTPLGPMPKPWLPVDWKWSHLMTNMTKHIEDYVRR